MIGYPFSFGQRIAIKVLAFADRRGVDHVRLRRTLRHAFRWRSGTEIEAMWRAAIYGDHPAGDLSGRD